VLLEQWRSFARFVLDKSYINSVSKLEHVKQEANRDYSAL
jgi:hypothetical protein